jgi:hypothetical protein
MNVMGVLVVGECSECGRTTCVPLLLRGLALIPGSSCRSRMVEFMHVPRSILHSVRRSVEGAAGINHRA